MPELVMAVLQRPVVEVAAGQFHQQAIAVVDFRAEIIGFRMSAFAEPEHRGERRQAKLADRAAQGDFRVDVHHRFRAGSDGELVGTGHALAIEQRPGDERLGVFLRALEIERGEIGKLLGHAGQAAVDRQSAGRQAIGRVGRDGLGWAGSWLLDTSDAADDLSVV